MLLMIYGLTIYDGNPGPAIVNLQPKLEKMCKDTPNISRPLLPIVF